MSAQQQQGTYLFFGYIISSLCLFFYSFTQIDLGLSLSRYPFFESIQRSFQYIGYFNRPLSTLLFCLIIGSLFGLYILLLRLSTRGQLPESMVWKRGLVVAGILVFSYNAFSYDLFNYMFDAKIVTYYHQNPYLHRALDFPKDHMLAFMHWTHRTYGYGPLWLLLTLPLSFVGMNFFLPTFFLFKFAIGAAALGIVYVVFRILPKEMKSNGILLLLNPLFLIEAFVSAHNDVAMLFFAVWGLSLFLEKKKLLGMIVVLLSVFIKGVTLPLLLMLMVLWVMERQKKKLSFTLVIWLVVGGMGIEALWYLLGHDIQPWYYLWFLPFLALVKNNIYTKAVFFVGIPLGLILRYAPFLLSGVWDQQAMTFGAMVTVLCPLLSLFLAFGYTKIGKGR